VASTRSCDNLLDPPRLDTEISGCTGMFETRVTTACLQYMMDLSISWRKAIDRISLELTLLGALRILKTSGIMREEPISIAGRYVNIKSACVAYM
jgi:hypothetical protein